MSVAGLFPSFGELSTNAHMPRADRLQRMNKDYVRWHAEKARINSSKGAALFHEREVWWCSLGANVGYEQDGGKDFMRPVVILKKFNLDSCLIVPLTGRVKHGRYYYPIGMIGSRDATAILSQIRFADRKRLTNKIATLDGATFRELVRSVIRANLSP
jgi:mRNA interferase MazF